MRTIAILGCDYAGLRPRMSVIEGDRVRLGQQLFVDKRDPQVSFTAPGSGTVNTINRGARRALTSVVIDLDQQDSVANDYPGIAGKNISSLADAEIRESLCKSGLWTAFRTRPYSKVPQSDARARSIFVTAIDTNPLAADPAIVIRQQVPAFVAGLGVMTSLTEGVVHLCTGPGAQDYDVANVQQTRFSGPHPAGLPGTHIHHLDPVSTDRSVWHIGYQDVIAIGRLFREGILDVGRTVALGGAGFTEPRLVNTRLGANIAELVAGEIEPDDARAPSPRLLSGSVLNGRAAQGAEDFLGRYHLQVSTVSDDVRRQWLGWLGRSKAFSTAMNGMPGSLIPVESFDRLLPMDTLVVPLLRSLLIGDTDQAQALGCLELAPEDLALCSYVCPGKNDYGSVLRVNLDQIEREG